MYNGAMNTYLICQEKRFYPLFFANVEALRKWVVEFDLLDDIDNYVIEVTKEGDVRRVWDKERGWLD